MIIPRGDEFQALCRKVLLISGEETFIDDAWVSTHVVLKTLDGDIVISEGVSAWQVIGPNKTAIYRYARAKVRDYETIPEHILVWNGPEIDKLIPMIEATLVLDLMADA